jgi:hypothetical protein
MGARRGSRRAGDTWQVVPGAAVPAAGPRGALYPAELFQLGVGEVVAYVPVSSEVPSGGRPRMLEIPRPSWPWPCTPAPWPTWS